MNDLDQGYSFALAFLNRGQYRDAIRLARALLSHDPIKWRSALNSGGILIDVGCETKRSRLVREGLDLLDREATKTPSDHRAALLYNKANAYLALGQRERGWGPCTRPSLTRAITLFDESLELEENPEVRINLANALSGQGRVIEALDEYTRVLSENDLCHQAHANRATILERIYLWVQPHQGLLEVALQDSRRACSIVQNDPSYQRRNEGLVERLSRRVGVPTRSLRRRRPTRVARWIWENSLNLNLCPHCRLETPRAFDTYALPAHLKASRRRPRPDELVDMVNALHRSFACARWILLQGAGVLRAVPDDHVVILENQGSQHDLKTGLLLDAASSFYGVINQVAYCVNSYYHLGHNPIGVDIFRVWSRRSQTRRFTERRSDLHPRLRRYPSRGLSALYCLARSFRHQTGRYEALRRLRNYVEHRLVVVREGDRTSRYFETVPGNQLLPQALRLGRIARAAILYLGAALWVEEHRRLKNAVRDGAVVLPNGEFVSRH